MPEAPYYVATVILAALRDHDAEIAERIASCEACGMSGTFWRECQKRSAYVRENLDSLLLDEFIKVPDDLLTV